jgi:hypothetical protein
MHNLKSDFFAPIDSSSSINTLASEPIVLPFMNIGGYIMINGSVDGIRGKFMFDSGTPFEFFFNNNKVNLVSDEFVSSGQAGSGQPITVFKQQKSVLVDLFYNAIRQECNEVMHTDFYFIQKGISSDFIGMIGGGSRKIFSIDYKLNEVVIYDSLPIIGDEYIKLTVINSHLPEVSLEVNGVGISGYFDTGNLGSLMLTKETELILRNAGYLNVTKSSWFNGEPVNLNIASIYNIKYHETDLGEVEQLIFKSGDTNRLGLGYSFLKAKKSIWDLENSTIYIARNE